MVFAAARGVDACERCAPRASSVADLFIELIDGVRIIIETRASPSAKRWTTVVRDINPLSTQRRTKGNRISDAPGMAVAGVGVAADGIVSVGVAVGVAVNVEVAVGLTVNVEVAVGIAVTVGVAVGVGSGR